jgi:osmotically-inducible protein OsmY
MRNVSMAAAAVLLAGVCFAGAAPQKSKAAAAAPVHARAVAPAASKPRMSDKEVEATIRAKFAKSKIGADKFTVHVQGGVATLEGKTDVVQHKGTATRMCKTAGALAVNNHIQISEAAKQKAAANLQEGRRRVQVKRGDSRTDPRTSR